MSKQSSQNGSCKRGIWYWLFFCSLISNSTLLFIYWIQLSRGYKFVDHSNYPVRGGIVDGTFIATTLFLCLIGPFFFRRLKVLAILGWVIGAISFLFICSPTF
jgi:hypothetical protein